MPSASDDDLPKLRRLFAKEVKRNLFQAYLRPNKTVIKVISNSISSSSCPGGDGIQFSASPKGHHLLAYNSSRIHVIDTRKSEIEVKREFKILRRPAATCINDQGTMLAVLLTEMEVDIYDLSTTPPKRTHSLILDHSPRAIALSPCGTVLAAAYEGGIEVSSLNPGALSTERRAVKCDAVDSLAFSFDGTQILGTTTHTPQPNTVILTAPYYDPGSSMGEDDLSALWTTSILFPNTSRDCSHATLIQSGKHDEASWTFTYDRSFEIFRAVRIDDLRNGTTYFTGPVPSSDAPGKLLPSTAPAASYCGELVSASFQGKDVWVYGIPEDLDAIPESGNTSSENGTSAGGVFRRNSGQSRTAVRGQDNEADDSLRVPQWQSLCDKLRNTFVGGYKIDELEGVHMVKWVGEFENSAIRERMIVAARGVSPAKPITEDEGIDFVDGGRITVIDFDYGVQNGSVIEKIIEVGSVEPEVLEEEHRDLEAEVAIVRRRTVAQKRGSRMSMVRVATTASNPPPLPAIPPQHSAPEDDEDDPLLPRRIGALPPRRVEPPPIDEEADTQLAIEEQEALDAPYAHASPRSGTTLRRAATAAANNRRLHPQAAAGRVEYRRADGRTEHPHESDADNWVPPPPPYQKEDPGEAPSFLRHTVQAGALLSAQQIRDQTQAIPADQRQGHIRPMSVHSHIQSQTAPISQRVSPGPATQVIPPVPPLPLNLPPPILHRREGSGSTVRSRQENPVRPMSRDSRYHEGENIYDVSPPDSPTAAAVTPHDAGDISRLPSESRTVSGPVTNSHPGVITADSSPNAYQQPPPPTLPRLQTTISFVQTLPPSFQLHTPSSSGGVMPAGSSGQEMASPAVRRLSNAGTWPMQPKPQQQPPVVAGYPYSAPPTNVHPGDSLAHSLPPAPRPDQLTSLNNRSETPRRLSGAFQVPRVAVGSRASGDYTPRRSSIHRPPPQQQQYSQYPQQGEGYGQMHQPQPRRLDENTSVGPQEDIPLIISTPKGVTGAFDPPGQHAGFSMGQPAEPPLLAPVPRHPRPTTQAAVLRPQVERLETIYSVASSNGAGAPGQLAPVPPGTRLVGGVLVPSAPGSTSSTTRVPSLNRRQSRAERSAAKNIADAKRKGWAGRTRAKSTKRKKKQKDDDAMSTAAWTDVTTGSYGERDNRPGSSATGMFRSKADRKTRCVVM